MLLGKKYRKSNAAREAAAKHGPPNKNQKGVPKGGAAVAAKAKVRATAQQIMDEMGYDPMREMVKWAEGDVVGLRLMTKAELDEPGKTVLRGRRVVYEPSGQEKALILIPPEMRSSMAKELARYGYSKKPTSVEVSGNGATAGGVVFYLPSNGRDEPALAPEQA